jgi:molybdate-binding protein/DNA-binding transcriptional regulator YhcF (GntR family)
MLKIYILDKPNIPLYQQIVDQLKQQIANNQIKTGEQLPPVRALANYLDINPATVARAYQELAKDGILGASRRRGTIVLGDSANPTGQALRQNRLVAIIDNVLLDTLSQGYAPDELEATFSLQLARWRFQRETSITENEDVSKEKKTILKIVGSNDLALDLVASRLKHQHPEIEVKITPAGSLGGLIAIQEGSADIAGIHLLDEETGQYNYPYIKHTLQGMEVAVVHLVDRIQGLMVAKGNPKNVSGIEDLKRPDITFINRQKGSGTRVWLDYKLRELEIQSHTVKGYNREVDTHIAVAMSIVKGQADVGLGIQAVAVSNNLDFIPTAKEKFDLVIPKTKYQSQLFAPLLEIIKSDEFKKTVNAMGGYDTSQTGETVLVT